MRHFFCSLLLLSLLAACEGGGGGASFGSRPQLKFIAESEGRLTKVEHVVRDFNEGARFADHKPDQAKMTAMLEVQKAAQAARQKLDALKSSGSYQWETKKDDISKAIEEAEKTLATAQAF
jgi:hypothetical protein